MNEWVQPYCKNHTVRYGKRYGTGHGTVRYGTRYCTVRYGARYSSRPGVKVVVVAGVHTCILLLL